MIASVKVKTTTEGAETQVQAEKVKDLKETPVVSASIGLTAATAILTPPLGASAVGVITEAASTTTIVASVATATNLITASNEDAQKSKSPVPEINHQPHQQISSVKEKDKNVPKSIEDGNKRVSSKPKWARLDVEPKSAASQSSSSNANPSSTQHRRRSPPRRRGGDDYRNYRDDRDDRSIRRSGSNRGNVPSNRSGPRRDVVVVNAGVQVAAVSSAAVAATAGNGAVISTNNTTNMKPMRQSTSSSRRDNNNQYITRSTRPSYTESKTPGLNGNPVVKNADMYDVKKQKPSLIGRPIIIEAGTPIVTNVYGTYYFNGPAPFTLETIGNIKESIKKQM